MPALKHIHTYIRVDGSDDKFMCFHPTCTHFMNKRYLVGKMTKCYKCENQFILDREMLKRKYPLCIKCRDTKEAKAERAFQNSIDTLMKDIKRISE